MKNPDQSLIRVAATLVKAPLDFDQEYINLIRESSTGQALQNLHLWFIIKGEGKPVHR